MKFYTKQHKYYCGIDLHARTMYVCISDQQGNILVHKDISTNADYFLQVISYSPLSEWNGTRAQISFQVTENSVHSFLEWLFSSSGY